MEVFILTHLRAAFHVYTHWIQKMKGFCNVYKVIEKEHLSLMRKERPNVMSYADVGAWECSENTYFASWHLLAQS